MQQLDFLNHTEAGESASRTLGGENAKQIPGWANTAIWVIIIVSWCGFSYLAFCVH
jgi:hypothetical protein